MAKHIKAVTINSFRGILDLHIQNLSDINIIVGNNNCGKTSVLEALMLINKPYSFNNVLRTAIKRENRLRVMPRSYLSNYEAFIYLFNKLDNFYNISISAQLENANISWAIRGEITKVLLDESQLSFSNNSHYSNIENENMYDDEIEEFEGELECLIENSNNYFDSISLNGMPKYQEIRFNKYSKILVNSRNSLLNNNLINMHFISSSDYLFDTSFRSIIKDSKITSDVITLLHIFDEDIINLKIIESDDRKFIQVVEHKSLGIMPISLYGDGFKKVITLANAVVQSKNGILLVDEVEAGIHVSAMNKVFYWLVNACQEFNVQLFLTTHSLETLDQILLSDKNIIDNDLIRVITLVKKNSNTIARILPGSKALRARNNYDMELR